MLIAPCSTADPGIAGAVLIQNKPNTKIDPGLVMPFFSLKMARKLPVYDQIFLNKMLSVFKNFL